MTLVQNIFCQDVLVFFPLSNRIADSSPSIPTCINWINVSFTCGILGFVYFGCGCCFCRLVWWQCLDRSSLKSRNFMTFVKKLILRMRLGSTSRAVWISASKLVTWYPTWAHWQNSLQCNIASEVSSICEPYGVSCYLNSFRDRTLF